MANEVEALLAACWASPADDEPRILLGDALLERGDPRGEFIALQRKRLAKGTATPSAAERALLKKHGEKWLGRLGAWLRTPSFHLGVLDGAAVKGGRWELGAAADWPEWATLRELDARGVASIDALFLATKLSPTVLNGVEVHVLQQRFASHGPLLVETLRGLPPFANPDGAADWEHLAEWPQARAALPRLRHLSLGGSSMMVFSDADYKTLLAAPIASQLETLSLEIQSEHLGALVGLLPKQLQRLECRWGKKAIVVDLKARTIAGPTALLEGVSVDGFRVG